MSKAKKEEKEEKTLYVGLRTAQHDSDNTLPVAQFSKTTCTCSFNRAAQYVRRTSIAPVYSPVVREWEDDEKRGALPWMNYAALRHWSH